ncbi:MAG: EAL domain-containing protein [Acidobacteriota bacterium]|nr:EAL domain-containing protein [Acidobacteriota bacterium]
MTLFSDKRIAQFAAYAVALGGACVCSVWVLNHYARLASLLNPHASLLTTWAEVLASLALFLAATTSSVLGYRCRKSWPFNWIVGSVAVFLWSETVHHELYALHTQPNLRYMLGNVSALALLSCLCALPATLGKLQVILEEASSARRNETRLRAVTESSHDAILVLEPVRDEHGALQELRISFANSRCGGLFGYANSSIVGELLPESFTRLRRQDRLAIYEHVLSTGEPATFECSHPSPCDAKRQARLFVRVARLADGLVMTITDVTEWHTANKELKRALSFSKALVSGSPFCTIVTDEQGVITSVNPAGEQLLGYAAGELIGHELLSLHLHDEIVRRSQDLQREFGESIAPNFAVFRTLAERGRMDAREWTYVRQDGTQFPVHVSVTALKEEDGRTLGYMAASYDLTERKTAEEYIYYIAHHDTLTGLPTRALLIDRLGVAMERARRANEHLAVMMIDLDHFKRVNDSLGHKAGDELLCEVANRLRKCVRKSDTVARMGGDEFVILLPDLKITQDAELVARKLQDALSEPIQIGGNSIIVSGSIGVSLFPQSDDIDGLLKNADIAMYRVKGRGRNGLEVYNSGLEKESLQKLKMETALRAAIHAGEFEIVYQPQIAFADNRMIGAEALLRWTNPTFGKVPPDVFIPIAEETGLIVPISEWVLRTACKQIAALQRKIGKEISLAVNISPRQFQQKNFPATIEAALHESGLRTEQLELEITEHLLMIDSEESLEIMNNVRKLGVRFAIDDFGTGFSNMGYITRFAVDRIKIDRSFISRCESDSNSRAVTSAIIALAHSLGIEVIAEGVETTQHVEYLTSVACDQAQGYLYSRPLSLERLHSFATVTTVAPIVPSERSGVRRVFADIASSGMEKEAARRA